MEGRASHGHNETAIDRGAARVAIPGRKSGSVRCQKEKVGHHCTVPRESLLNPLLLSPAFDMDPGVFCLPPRPHALFLLVPM